ncbi:MAG: DUF1592 domain-containing protein [Deltaproteobacteria bacterium]|nr:DUF1592 domain-containing protein [Deltaproteobacteria bacterium]
MTNKPKRGRWAVVCASMLGLTGCYQGLGGEPGDSAGPGAAEGGDDDADSRVPPASQCSDVDAGPSPLRRLTRTQYDHTVHDLLGVDLGLAEGFVSDEKIGTFDSNAIAAVTELSVEQYMDSAESVANEVVLELSSLLPCDPETTGEDACAQAFIAEFGPRAYRRPLTDDQRDDAFALYLQGRAEGSFVDGIRLVVQGMLQSPFFLYHVEDVPPPGELAPLSPYEVASRLSYFLWESMPDDTLTAAAAANALSTPEQIREQAERMIDDARASVAIGHFHVQWLTLEELATQDKDEDLFPQFSATLAESMRTEVERFAEYVIRHDDARLETLLTASYSMVNPDLAEIYGVTLPMPDGGFQRVDLPQGERAGVLTTPAVMSAHAHHNQTSPVLRGVLVRENLLCHPLPLPADNVNDNPPGLDPSLPTKERWAQHRDDPECFGCHILMDPLGFAFENYDAVGQYRTMEGDLAVDASGEFVGTEDIDGSYDGPVDFAQQLAGSEQAQACVATQWFRYALGRLEGPADDCSLQQITSDFASSDHDIRELMVSIAVSDAVRHVKAAQL